MAEAGLRERVIAAQEGGIWHWLETNQALMWWLFIGSIASLVLCLLLLPVIVVRLEADYFVASRKQLMTGRTAGSWLWHIGKNMLGAVFVIVGVALLVLPGQGLLTIFIGLLMLEFPGKRAIELCLVRRPSILKLLTGMREKRGREPFVFELSEY